MRHLSTLFSLLVVLALQAQERPDPRALIELVRADLEKVGFSAEDLADVTIKDHYATTHNGVQHTYMRQRWQGVEVWQGEIAVHRGPDGSVVKLNVGAIPGIATKVNATSPAIGAEAALAAVIGREGLPVPRLERTEDGHKRIYDGTDFGGMPVTVQLVYWPVDTVLRLVWAVDFSMPNGEHWWDVKVDALTGQELDRVDRIIRCEFDGDHAMHDHGEQAAPTSDEEEELALPAGPTSYRVYAPPVESPNHGNRSVVTLPWLAGGIASPYGWHDTNGASGAEHTITRGNNVHAQEDMDGVNSTPGFSPDGGPFLDFDFPIDLAQGPGTYQAAAITNLFYWNNILHDVLYAYGFDEGSGNYQQNNYGRGGTEGDAVLADALDGGGLNNANFQPTVDGVPGRMQMFIWDHATPERTSDLDNLVIAHEYGHGLSTRLVGGPGAPGCLQNGEHMGEGWSDYIGLMMTMKNTDTRTTPRGVGTYLRAQPITGNGIRPAPYTTDMGVNSYTYASTNLYGGLSQPHGIGFMWCTMLWEMTWDLIDQYGFSPDLYNGNGGNNIALQLVVDGMKFTPCDPGFIDARDAILVADQVNYNGANQTLIKQAFARRGLGYYASQGSSSSRDDQVESFALEPLDNNLTVQAILAPSSDLLRSCGPWIVNARVRNMGLLPQNQVTLRYQLDNGPVVTRIVIASLTHLQSIDINFPLYPLPLIDPGQYVLRVWVDLPGDELSVDDEKSVTINLSGGDPLPHYGNATGYLPGYGTWSAYVLDPGAVRWQVFQTSFSSSCSPEYVYSASHSPYYGTRGIQSPYLELPVGDLHYFSYKRAYVPRTGNTVTDTLRVMITTDCGQTWSLLQQLVSPAMATSPPTENSHLTSCGYWVNESIPLTAFEGETVRIRIETASSGNGRTHVSHLRVSSFPPPVEVALVSFMAPQEDLFFHCDGTPQPVSMRLYSGGSLPATGFEVGYRVNGGPWVMESFIGTMEPGTFGTHFFATPMQLAQPGAYALEAKVFVNDQNLSNNTLSRNLELVTVNTLNTPPWPYAVEVNAEDGAVVPIEWNLQNADQGSTWENVQVPVGKTCSLTRAWRMDHSSNTPLGTQNRLVSPILQLNPGNRATLRFDHAYAPHPDPLRADGFRVDLSLDCGASWVSLFDQAGAVLGTAPATSIPWVPGNCTHWRSTIISLADYDGQAIMVRFVAINDNGNRFYLDNIRMDQVPYVNAWVSELQSPTEGPLVDCGGNGIPVTVVVGNRGALAMTNIQVRYRLDNGPWVNEVVQGTFNSNGGATHTFSQPLTGLSVGPHVLLVETQVPGDQLPADNGVELNFQVEPSTLVQAPYLEGVEAGATVPTGWALENPDGLSTWSNSLLSIGADCVSSRSWTRNFVGDPNWGEQDRLISPQINLSPLHGARLKFDHAYSINPNGAQSSDQLQVQVSTNCGQTWTTVFTRSGSALATAPNSTATPWVPTNCSQWSRNSIDLSAYDGEVIQLRFVAINGGTGRLYMDNVQLMNEELVLSLKLLLEGPFVSATNLMNDNLRSAGLSPTSEPYTALGFQRVADPGVTSLTPSLLNTTGNNAAVDWVMVELRSASAPSVVKATRCMLVQRDGDVMSPVNGTTTFRLPGNPGMYYVAVRHRNHLGVMTSSPVFLGPTASLIDLTLGTTPTYGTEARKIVGTRRVLWAGNTVPDGQLRYTGSSNDRDAILQAVGGVVPSNTLNGYRSADVNMDGVVKYTGDANDRDVVLQNIGGVVPTNTRNEQLP